MKVTVLGTGAWGETLADLLQENLHDVVRWSRRSPQSLGSAIAQSAVVVSAVSMKGVQSISQQVKALGLDSAVAVAKPLVAETIATAESSPRA